MKRFILLISVIICCFITKLYSQNFSYKQYTTFDGLVQNQITALIQDHNGFIWVGTRDGISKFDGLHFVNYKGIKDVIYGLNQSFKEVNKLLFWQTYNKIYLINNESFIELFKSDSEISSFQIDSLNKTLIIYTLNKQIKLSLNKNYKSYTSKKLLNIDYLITFRNNSYILSNKGIFKKQGKDSLIEMIKGSISNIININNNLYFSKRFSVSSNDNNNLGIYKFDGKQLNKIYKDNYTPLIYKLKNNNILCISKPANWTIIDTLGNIIEKDSMNGICINNCMEDNEGNIWFGTENGLMKLHSFAFRNYTEKSGIGKYIWSIVQAEDSSILFASYNGNLFKLKNNEIKPFNGFKHLVSKEFAFYMGGISTKNADIFLPANMGIIIRYSKGKFDKLDLENKEIKSCFFYIYEDTIKNRLILGAEKSLFIYDLSHNKMKYIEIEGSNALCIEKDKYKRFWIGGRKLMLLENDTLSNFNSNEALFDKGIISMCKDNRENMWLCSKDGIYIHTYNQYIKIINESSYFIKLYKNKYLITGGVSGLYYINLDKFYNKEKDFALFFNRFNGFEGIECGQNGSCIDNIGHIWIPTSDRVVEFIPEKIKFNNNPPQCYIYSVEISKNDLRWQHVEKEIYKNNKTLFLQYNTNNIRINYNGISTTYPEKVIFKTRLAGLNDNWSEPTSERLYTQTNIPNGEYFFELLACNANGIWTKLPYRLKIIIIPAFWQTWWFFTIIIIICIALISISINLYFRKRKQNEEKKARIEKKLINLQLSTLNAQLDPHFVFNAINAIGVEVQINNPAKAYNHFVKISNLLRSSLKNTDQISRSLQHEIDFVTNYLVLQKLRFGNRFDYKIEIDDAINMQMQVPKMCIQIFAENAVKHGLEHILSEGMLLIKILYEHNYLIIFVEDNGIGRKQSAKLSQNSTGIGLKVYKEFFDISNKFNSQKAGFEITDVEDPQGEALGTKVKVFLPVNYKFSM